MADITAEGSIVTSSARSMRSIVFTSALVGYWFFFDSDDDLFYQKTTNGGTSWGSPVEIDTDTTIVGVALDVWYDKWTPGNNGTKIHIAWTTSDDGDVNYRALDTATDTLGTQVVAFNGASAVAGRGCFVSIAVARSGYIYIAYDIDAGVEKGIHRSTDGGAAFSASLDATFIEATLDEALLFPASNTGDDNDIWAVYHDADANALTLKMWDSSAAAAVESSTIQTYLEGATDLTGQHGFSGSIRHHDGHLILAAVSERDAGTSDHQVFDINGTGSIVTLAAITTNIDDHYHPAVFIDQSTTHIYVFYNGKRDGTEVLGTTTKVYYTKSTDNGSSWSAGDTAYMEGATAVVVQVWAPLMGLRLYAGWRVGTTLVANAVNSIDLTPPLSNLSYDHRRLQKGPMPFPSIERKRPVEPVIADTLVALSGVAATLAAGLLGAALDSGLLGSAGTGAISVGPLTQDTAISGTAATGQISSSMGAGPELVGVQAIGARGSVTTSIDSPLTGTPATSSLGTLTTPRDIALTGLAGTSAVSSLADSVDSPLVGLVATGSVGSISAGSDGQAALSGVVGTNSLGTFGTTTDGSESGVGGTGNIGTSIADISEALSGLQATSGLSSLSTGTFLFDRPRVVRGPFPFPKAARAFAITADGTVTNVALTGVSGTGAPGDIDTPNDVVTALSGLSATSIIGNLQTSTPGTADLLGVQGTSGTGNFIDTLLPAPLGVQATGQLGTLIASRQSIERPPFISGPFPFFPGGILRFRERARPVQVPLGASTVILTGVSGTSAISSLTTSSTRAFTGAPANASVGTMPANLLVSDYEAIGIGAVGSLGLGQALTNVTGTGQTGTEGTTVTTALTGVEGAGSVRSMTASSGGDSTVGLTGLQAVSALGTLSGTLTIPVTGFSGTTAIGAVIDSVDIQLASVVATAATGTLTASTVGATTLAGLQASASISSVISTPVPVPTGQVGLGQIGDIGLEARVILLTGVGSSMVVGNLRLDEGSILDFSGTYITEIDIVGELE